jgi:hypothetical protein
MTLVASIVDWNDVLQVIWVSFAAGLGVTAVFTMALLGATRFVDYRRDGRMAEAAVFGIVAAVGSAGVAAAVVFAIVVMTNKS